MIDVKYLKKIMKNYFPDTRIYVQVGDQVYPLREKVMTCLSGEYIRLIADETQSRYEEPIGKE